MLDVSEIRRAVRHICVEGARAPSAASTSPRVSRGGGPRGRESGFAVGVSARVGGFGAFRLVAWSCDPETPREGRGGRRVAIRGWVGFIRLVGRLSPRNGKGECATLTVSDGHASQPWDHCQTETVAGVPLGTCSLDRSAIPKSTTRA